MSGYSKWAKITHKKGTLEAKRGKIFTRLIREITMAAKTGGGDPDSNPRLSTAIAAARAENMPSDNIKRAIQRGTGELPGANYEEIILEGYGPGGAALVLAATTDNRNRTMSEIRHIFTKGGGNLREAGSVAWMFEKKGSIVIPKSAAKEEDLMNIVLENGGEDLRDNQQYWEIITDPASYHVLLNAVNYAKIEVTHSEIGMTPQHYIELVGPNANQLLHLIEALEDHNDVQSVYSNVDIAKLADLQDSADFTITFDSQLTPMQVKQTLKVLADFYRECGGIGFEIDFELEDVLIPELVYA